MEVALLIGNEDREAEGKLFSLLLYFLKDLKAIKEAIRINGTVSWDEIQIS
ncbi:hypothetical protein [Nostoc sp.]|uniref:hypothetical protein n=1 Tax=Nostoc sp. TaxID=1180 RepID=UPI002FF525A2